jgi:hypothetical protein
MTVAVGGLPPHVRGNVTLSGETISETGQASSGDLGVLVVFGTNEFAAEGGHLTPAKEASLTASGSWALTAR